MAMNKIAKRIRDWRRRKERKYLEDFVKSGLQVREYEGEYWLTVRGEAVLPERFLKNDAVSTLKELRPMFVERIISERYGRE